MLLLLCGILSMEVSNIENSHHALVFPATHMHLGMRRTLYSRELYFKPVV